MKNSIIFIISLLPILSALSPLSYSQLIFREHSIDQAFTGAAAIDIKDLDNDGSPDIVAASHGTLVAPSCGVKCWINSSTPPGNFTPQVIDASYRSIACYSEDLNGDGYKDIMAASWTANSIVYWFNSGSKPIVWTRYTLVTNFRNAHAVYAADFDGDGDNDILGASAANNEISLWINKGGNPLVWEKNPITTSFLGVRSVFGGDVDEDGDIDFVATALASNQLAWWRNDGGSPVTWSQFILSTDFSGAHWAILHDMDGDSHLDILAAAWADNEVSWWRNNFDAPLSWTKYFIDTTFTGGFFATASDFDDDGDTDVFGTTQPGNMQSYWINDGAYPYNWTRHNLVSSNSQPWPAAPLDVDGDSKVDIVSGGNSMLGWWENVSNVPERPAYFRAYSDHTTPNSVHLTWEDPQSQTDGTPLTQFSLHLFRDGSRIALIDPGMESYGDTSLTNHQLYSYAIKSVTASESSDAAASASYAGGCPYALPPTLFTVRDSDSGARLQWKNPNKNIDGSAITDTFFVMIYRDSILLDSLRQSAVDTGMVKDYADPATGYHEYRLRIRDDDALPHYSGWTTSFLGYGGPYYDRYSENFETGGPGLYHTGQWDTTRSLAFKSGCSFTDSPHGNTQNFSSTFVLLPPISIDDTLTLSFFDIAIIAPPNSVTVEISADSRRLFSPVLSYNWDDYDAWKDGSADQKDWRRETLDLSPYIGDTVTLRFVISSYSGEISDGWYLDSIRVQPPDPPPSTVQLTLPLPAGWSLVSLPLKMNETDKDSIFRSSSSFAFSFESAYTICDSLKPGKGYWIKFDDSMSIICEGTSLPADTVELNPGWNMIGAITTPLEISRLTSAPEDISFSDFFWYDSAYRRSDTLKPGKGYWVKADRAGLLIISSGDDYHALPGINISLKGETPPLPPGGEKVTPAENQPSPVLELCQNHPNPFNGSTIFRISIPTPAVTVLRVFDILGRETARLVDGYQEAGYYSINWEAQNIPSGLYYYRLESGNIQVTKKLILLK